VNRVGVVIVNKNAGRHLATALESLERQTVAPDRIVVVDNASDDGSLDGLEERFPSVELVRSADNLGFAAGNNLAVRMCDDCAFVALLNPDAFPEPTWLETLLAAAADSPECGFFGSRLVQASDPGVLDGTGDEYHVSGLAWRRDQGSPATLAGEAGETFSVCAAAALYRRDAFLEVGGFDETFFCYYEDTDLAFRLRLAGHRCLYVPTAVARHVGSVTAGLQSAFTIYHSSRNQVWTYVKNMPSPLLWLYLPQHLLTNALTLLAFAVQGQARAGLRGKRDAVRELPRVLAERRRIQAARAATVRELRDAMARGPGGYVRTFFGRALAWRRGDASALRMPSQAVDDLVDRLPVGP
jgi:GT2 family glycosyltransferase